jgi:hypothetical protein
MAWRYGWFAERYHWTPTQVDEQPAWVINQFASWASAVDEAKATLQEEAQAQAEREARRKG